MKAPRGKLTVVITAVCGVVLSTHVSVLAQSIGVHFPSNRDNARLQPDEIAGVRPQANWNSADGGTDNDGVEGPSNRLGETANISLPVAGDLLDSAGDPAGVTVTWVSNGTWNTTNGSATPDAKLMNGYIDAFSNAAVPEAPGVSVSFEGIPYDHYFAIVYVGADGNNRAGNVTDGTTTYRYLTQSNDPGGDGGFDPATDFIYISNTDPDNRAPGNYAIFDGLTEPDLTISIVDWTGGNNNGIHAVQIVASEPLQVPLVDHTGLILLGFSLLVVGGILLCSKRTRWRPAGGTG